MTGSQEREKCGKKLSDSPMKVVLLTLVVAFGLFGLYMFFYIAIPLPAEHHLYLKMIKEYDEKNITVEISSINHDLLYHNGLSINFSLMWMRAWAKNNTGNINFIKLSNITGTYQHGITFIDSDRNGMLSVGDYFVLDRSRYDNSENSSDPELYVTGYDEYGDEWILGMFGTAIG